MFIFYQDSRIFSKNIINQDFPEQNFEFNQDPRMGGNLEFEQDSRQNLYLNIKLKLFIYSENNQCHNHD